MTTPSARIMRALEWFNALGPTQIDERDVTVVAALGIRDESVGRELALHSAAALLPRWGELVSAVDGVVVQQVVSSNRWGSQQSRRGDHQTEELGAAAPAEAGQSEAGQSEAIPEVVPQGRPSRRSKSTEWEPQDTTAVGASAGKATPQTSPTRAAEIVDMGGFEPYTAVEIDYASAQSLAFAMAPDGNVRIAWTPASASSGEVAVYRVVTSMAGEPYSPDQNPVGATTDLVHVNDDPRREPYLNVQVWVNVGADIPAAKRAQPTLHARGLMVLPPANFDIRVSEGQVAGSWPVASDDVTVDVMCVEAHLSERIHGFDPTRRLESVQQGGFRHDNPPSGSRLEYRVVARLERMGGDGHMRQGTSPYLSRFVDTPAVIEAVTDLEVNLSGEAKVDLSWTTPPSAVDVHIYMTEVEPPAGLHRQDLIDRSSLDQSNLVASSRLIHPTDKQDGRTWMRDVPWPRSWARAWFVPVTVLDDQHMKAGPALVRSRPPEPVTDLRLVDRVDTKTLTFDWPEAVELVRVYVTPRGVDLDPATQAAVQELTQEDYRRFGGLQIPPGVLNDDPSTVHAVSTTYSNYEAIMARPVTIEYSGMRQLRYFVVAPEPAQGRGAPPVSPGQRILRVESQTTWDRPVRFGLYFHRTHLPLTTEGAELAAEFTWQPNKDEPLTQEWDLSRGIGGFIRLFALVSDLEQRTLAITDPVVEQLRIS
ncbi:hypothetical protein ASE01_12145 [Nocardioides sp. Root190]|uniref:hypothetical protein n=1 Tax=Nocardioides sp. Root190 TaxID=1736488 RepID=UPI0006F31CC4|nr:hypothetical protein [Nocardioides sp. Root190]KRB75806.1 hypothetical protein ASE01_12145 [Nocardioides sp. Root190]